MENILIILFFVAIVYLFNFFTEGASLFFLWKKYIKNSFSLSFQVNLISTPFLLLLLYTSSFILDWMRITLHFNNTIVMTVALPMTLFIIKLITIIIEVILYSRMIKKNPEKFIINKIGKKRITITILIANILSFSTIFLIVVNQFVAEKILEITLMQ